MKKKLIIFILKFILDFFSENNMVKSVNLTTSFTHAICFTVPKENLINLRVYKINIDNIKTDQDHV